MSASNGRRQPSTKGPPSQKKFAESRIDTHKAANPFSSNRRHKTAFSQAYANGAIPCHIEHGSVKKSLKWTNALEDLDYDPLLITCFEGLCETEHPYVFVSRTMIKELLDANGAYEKVQQLVPSLVQPLRMALMSKETDTFRAANIALKHLSEIVGERLNPYLPNLLVQLNKRLMESALREDVTATLQTLEEAGGDVALKTIKSKIPTYGSIRR